jgi:hypothetical protein
MGRRPGEAPHERRPRERDRVHLLGARDPQRAGAFVERGAGRVDVVDERHRPRSRTRGERAAHVAPAPGRIEPALRADVARASQRARDGEVPEAPELGRELGRRVGSAQQAAVAYGGDDDERFGRRARKLVDDEDRPEPRGGDLAALPTRDDLGQRPLEPERRARRRQPAQPRARAARDHGERGRGTAACAQRCGQRAQVHATALAQPLARTPAGRTAAWQEQADERAERHAARLGAGTVPCPSRFVPERAPVARIRSQQRAGSARTAPGGRRPRSRSP